MSLPEVLLWQQLRLEPYGLKFRRQHPVLTYILDFYCARAKLAVEIDGEAHDRGNRPARDGVRDAALAAYGLTIHRIPARDVLADPAAAAEAIAAAALPLHPRLCRRSPSPSMLGEDLEPFHKGPPPRAGEDLNVLHPAE
ncbi:endonuclease domain-containing protein [Sphingomonas sp. Leaf23]|uniref:endonuclease domain-containing protein n=1 Tax=Sphingomonas sp. Leaf23 TaxID=1735689 RepID=UPI000A3E0228|nr:endonuclease domain-containing protein [Sphingomonas sp. Leaf23]